MKTLRQFLAAALALLLVAAPFADQVLADSGRIPGPRGMTGPQGPMGPRGNAILQGAGAPSPIIGIDGDFYLDTTGLQLYGPKAGNAWPGSPILLGLPTVPVPGALGGTGVVNSGKTITLGGNLATSGSHALTFTLGAPTNVSVPASGTLLTTTGNGSGLTGLTVGQLGAIASQRIVSNVTGGSAAPAANTLTSVLDAVIGAAPGTLLYRGGSAWSALAPGNPGEYLRSQGSSLQWATTPVLRSYLAGFGLARASNTTLDIAAGVAADAANTTMIERASTISKTTASPWVAGSGNGGMGNGLTVALNTWYDVCLGYNAGAPDVWFDTSNRSTTYSECANKPAGITGSQYRRIGTIRTESGGNILAFTQAGDLFQFALVDVSYQQANPGTSALTIPLRVPTGFRVTGLFQGFIRNTATSGGSAIYCSDLLAADEIPDQTTFSDLPPAVNVAGGVANTGGRFSIVTNESGQVRCRLSTSTASLTLSIWNLGWIDRRGRDR